MKNPTGLDEALASWRDLLGPAAVRSAHECEPYRRNCMGLVRSIPAAVLPADESQVIEVVRTAARLHIPLYPVSTGKNWGYGTASPVVDDCVVVDLSRLNRIIDLDDELGVVTLQPGVTQQQLCDYLEERNSPHMVPVTGAGPTCSLLGNALERGYGITPYGDHFAAVTTLQAVLADGTLYQSALGGLGGGEVDRLYKWGVGPYLDGLFTQSGFAIVTQASIVLARRPDKIGIFLAEIPEDSNLEPVVEAVRELMQISGGGISGINLMNRRRMLSMTSPYPRERVAAGEIMSTALVEEMGKRQQLPPWTGLGAIYGDPAVVAGLKRAIRSRLKPYCKRLVFLDTGRVGLLQHIARYLPGSLGSDIRRRLTTIEEFFDILSGRPRETALRLAYWRSGQPPAPGVPLDPARDGCGLLWYAPLVPMKAGLVRQYLEMVETICSRHGIEPLITLTTLSERCFDSTVPILFDPATDRQRAWDCYQELFREGCRQGFMPYRMSVTGMGLYTDTQPRPSYWALVGRLKQALDPDNIMSPGRYSPRPPTEN